MSDDLSPQVGDTRIRFDPEPFYEGDDYTVILERYTDLSVGQDQAFLDWWELHKEGIIEPGRIARFFGDTLDRRVKRGFKRCRGFLKSRERTRARSAIIKTRYPTQKILQLVGDGGQE